MQREAALADEAALRQNAEESGTLLPSAPVWPWNWAWFVLLTFRENTRLKAEVDDWRNRYKELEEENLKLYEQLHLGCDTSSIPSSKGWKKNDVPQENEKPTGSNAIEGDEGSQETPIPVSGYLKNRGGEKRRPGGQKNHPPAFMRVTGVQEREPVLHYPDACAHCPRMDRCKEEGKFRKHFTGHGYDIEG